MNKTTKFKMCNRWLAVIMLLIFISGLQLEVTSGMYPWSVWVHIFLGIVLSILSLYHILLHYRKSNWFARFARNRNTSTRILWWAFLLTAISGIAASFIWAGDYAHSKLGAVHGKFGFLMVIMVITHVSRHIKRLKKNKQTVRY